MWCGFSFSVLILIFGVSTEAEALFTYMMSRWLFLTPLSVATRFTKYDSSLLASLPMPCRCIQATTAGLESQQASGTWVMARTGQYRQGLFGNGSRAKHAVHAADLIATEMQKWRREQGNHLGEEHIQCLVCNVHGRVHRVSVREGLW